MKVVTDDVKAIQHEAFVTVNGHVCSQDRLEAGAESLLYGIA
jgi:hypothetical protein